MRAQNMALAASLMIVLTGIAGLPSLGQTSPSGLIHVHIDDSAYDPDPVIVRPGDTVEWDNHDSAPHDATADNNDWFTAVLSQDESDSIVFTESGTWGYHCSIHPTIEGTLHVNLPPEVAITTPEDGASVEGLVTIEGTADDPDGDIEEVEIRIDGGDWQTVSGTTSWSYEWDTLQAPNGETLIEVRADDGIELSGIESMILHVDNPLFVDLEIKSDDIDAEIGPLTTDIHVTIQNHGNTPSVPFTLLLEYEHNDEFHMIGEADIAELGAFESITVTITWDTLGKIGDFPVTATADPDGETGDIDPTNNQATTAIGILISGIDGIDLFDL